MAPMSTDPVMLSIQELFSNGDNYLIPIYQRSYDWGQEHLHQLLEDVWDMACNAPQRNYYLGTMVAYYNKSKKVYEILDGQQRMLTLAIILCALKNDKNAGAFMGNKFTGVNVELDLREASTQALQKLYEAGNKQPGTQKPSSEEEKDEADAIRTMYEEVVPTLTRVFERGSKKDNDENTRFTKFSKYLLKKVIITRILLPPDTDLNHYFEIANTRGEQLEMHEIQKARIFQPLKADKKTLWLAGRIWDACSDMNRYVVVSLKADGLGKFIFTDTLDSLKPNTFDDLLGSYSASPKNENDNQRWEASEDQSMRYIIDNCIATADSERKKNENNGQYARFGSVINFPNFLLHVLRVMQSEDISLDDKRLLETFGKMVVDVEFSKKFLWTLLRLRFLFDKFVIRRDCIDNTESGKWKIFKPEKENNKSEGDSGYKYKNTFGESELQNEIIMREAMFHVSSPGQNYKHWLSGVLLHLSEHPDGQRLNEYLRELGKAYMRDHFLQPREKQLEYYKIIFQNKGIPSSKAPEDIVLPRIDKQHIDLFYFNYLDMQLWLKNKTQPFTFTSRNSVEHFYPQKPVGGLEPLADDDLHGFGNLCLISREKNSKLSNLLPQSKYEIYTEQLKKQREPDSLKQKKMMKVFEQKKAWGETEIRAHADEMKQLLIRSLADASPAETESSLE